MKTIYFKLLGIFDKLQSLPLLLIRLVLAYGFYGTAKEKVGNTDSIIEWFQSLEIPFPVLNAYLATYTEVIGVICLVLGLTTRFISVPLIIIMLVAIKTVHWENGFNASDNGYEIPLYYIVMLMVLITNGAGKLSADYFISKKFKTE